MIKRYTLSFLLLSLLYTTATAQTLFTYGSYPVDTASFIRAFKKNYQQQDHTQRSKALEEYLSLYIASKQKVREALDRKYDTLPQVKAELTSLREQIADNYMNDPTATDRLIKEAFERSKKDIHVAHIFIAIPFDDGKPDTITSRKKINTVLNRLAKGENFLTVAQQLSDDPAAKSNKGDIGFVTVFTLPYALENVVYSTPPGNYSKPYTSATGYHIFKNIAERKAVGKMKAQQILLAFHPGIDNIGKKKIKLLADSLYKQLQRGEEIGALAGMYSNDQYSANANGNIPDIGVGQYDAVFEKAVWALKNDGTITAPFATSHGYHIVKRLKHFPIITDATDKDNLELLRQKAMNDSRWSTAKDFIYTAVQEKAGYKKQAYEAAEFAALADSLLDYKPAEGKVKNLTIESVLFSIGNTAYRVQDWLKHSHLHRYKPDYSGVKTHQELMDEFVKASMYEYYRSHLEDFNQEFAQQMEEFKEGNLFFEIMQQEVWNRSQTDSTALYALYEKNKAKYIWQQSVDAVVFFCNDTASAGTLFRQINNDPTNWKQYSSALAMQVVADSSRLEWSQLPGLQRSIPKKGRVMPLVVNSIDQTASFAYIIQVYPQAAQRSFHDARGLLMTDYQELLEKEWSKELDKKYPVVVNKKMLELLKQQ